MDTKRLFIGMAVAMLLVMGWAQLVQYLHKNNPDWDWGNQPPVAATQPSEIPIVPTTAPAAMPTTVTTAPSGVPVVTTQNVEAVVTGKLMVIPAVGAKPTSIGSAVKDDPAAPMQLNINPHGAGLDSVVLNEFKLKVESDDPYVFQRSFGGEGDDDSRALATRSITIGGETIDLRSVDWIPVAPTTQPAGVVASATYRAVIGRGKDEVLWIDKTYTLTPKTDDGATPQGYEVVVSHTVTNRSGQAIDNVKIAMNGPMPPPVETDTIDDRQIVGGYYTAGHVTLNHVPLNTITRDSKPDELSFSTYEGKPLVWIGMSGVYFNAILRPSGDQPVKIDSAHAVGLNFDKPQYHHVILKLETNTFSVPKDGSVTQSSAVFFGPKKRQLLKTDYYSAPLVRYDQTLVLTGGPCAFCTIQWLVNGLYYLLRIFERIFRDWGLAIICLVLIVRAILHPITKKSQINMSKMSKMGPEIERLKKKYGDNKDELNKAMMQFYKQQGATPILGCLPMILQMPIWIALYSALQSTFELRQAPFLWGFTWIKDLAHPDRLIYFPNNPVNIWFIHFDAINFLPVILGVVSYVQAKIMQAQQPPSTTPEQETQKKLMVWMSLLLPVILYNGPSGLNLYIITSTTIGLIESHIVRKHIKEREELEKRGAVIVDGPPPDKDRPATGQIRRKQAEPEKTTGGLAGWISKLQNKAAEMQREQSKRTKKKK
jgi:YidC/Oxa1 family membrane protein insertase